MGFIYSRVYKYVLYVLEIIYSRVYFSWEVNIVNIYIAFCPKLQI
jgi:hypothetical protein